ncbi:MAG: threonine/serine dehydratase [Rhodobacteraceae bacterium]|nr:threonine/serine dehydratase [Paracoccaceae bacterium]
MQDYSDVPLTAISLDAIRARAALLAPHVRETPSIALDSPALTPLLGGGALFLKLECLQKTGTFKARGAMSVALSLPEDRRAAGLTAVSAGNHAIATAWAARHIGAPAKVVMMSSANPFRVARARAYGAEVVLVDGVVEAFAEAERLSRDEGLTFVHPYEGPFTTLGAAGVGLEFMTQVTGLDAVIVSVGGGGLISGVAAAVKQINPACKVYAVEPEGANSLGQSLSSGAPVKLDAVRTIADSLGAPGCLPFSFRVNQAYVDEAVSLSDDQICGGVVICQEEAKLAVEPAAGAAMAAALGPLRSRLQGKRVGVLMCGANIDAGGYGAILERGRDPALALLAP